MLLFCFYQVLTTNIFPHQCTPRTSLILTDRIFTLLQIYVPRAKDGASSNNWPYNTIQHKRCNQRYPMQKTINQ